MSLASPVSLRNEDLSPAFHAADRSSLQSQERFLCAVRIRLIGLVLAGAFGLGTWKTSGTTADWAGVLAATSFLVTVFVEIYLLRSRPDRAWYEGRAAAESIKTLCWRYSVGAEPFRINVQPGPQIEALFLKQVESVIGILKHITVAAPAAAGPQITAGMRLVREKPLADRKLDYETGRVVDQQTWYQRKALQNSQSALRWGVLVVLLEIAGVCAAIIKAVGLLEGDFLIFAGVLVATGATWLETKQYQNLATAYTVASLELASVRTKIAWQESEEDWAAFVNDAEQAFSREHTLWKASRGIQSVEMP